MLSHESVENASLRLVHFDSVIGEHRGEENIVDTTITPQGQEIDKAVLWQMRGFKDGTGESLF